MILMPNQHDARAIAGESHSFQMHFGDQRTCGVDHMQIPIFGLLADRGSHAVRAEDGASADGNFIQFFDEYGASLAQLIHDVFVVDNFFAHINWRPIQVQGDLDYIDSPYYASAKA